MTTSTTVGSSSARKIVSHYIYGTPLDEQEKNTLADLSKEVIIGGVGFPLAITTGSSIWSAIKAPKGSKLDAFKAPWTKSAAKTTTQAVATEAGAAAGTAASTAAGTAARTGASAIKTGGGFLKGVS